MHRSLATAVIAALSLAGPAAAASPASDWPSYNRTLASDRYSPLAAINAGNVAGMKVACTFDTGENTAFESGLVQVDGALFLTTQYSTYSINPDTCALNWKATEAFPGAFLDAQRGVAVADGRVFRGARNGHVYAYDQKTGAKLWEATLADAAKGESTPASPIAWNGLVFIGTAGGDNRGVKGRMYALDQASGKIAWEFYMVPKSPGDPERGPQARGAAPAGTWQNAKGVEITGGGTWTSYTLDPAKGELYVPGGNPAPDFAKDLRKGDNLYTGSVVVLDARTGDYKRHYQLVPEDFHDYDVSSAPLLVGVHGKRLMAVTPKNGFLYAYDLDSGKQLYKRPMTTQFNTTAPLSSKGDGTRFCPGAQGGSEWNGPAFDARNTAFVSGQTDWCGTVKMDEGADTMSVAMAQAWTGGEKQGFGTMDKTWGGWVSSSDALTGKERWKFKTPAPVVGGVTATAGGLVLFGDVEANLYALDSANGKTLGTWKLDGAVGGGVITYDTGAGQKVAVAAGLTAPIWPTQKISAKVVVLAP